MIKEILANFGSILCDILSTAIFIQILVSWVAGRHSRAYQFLESITEPLMKPIRRIIPPAGMIDFSPMIAMILLEVIKNIWTALIMMI